jgi:hypothetical protein
MEDWQKDLITILETVQSDFEEFCNHLTIAAETAAEDISEGLDNFVIEIENTLNREVEDFLEGIDNFVLELLEPLIDQPEELEPTIYLDLNLNTESDFDFDTPKVQPNSQQYSACVGCSNYHGKVYGGNLLVCAIHPYGWDDNNCPDWEK